MDIELRKKDGTSFKLSDYGIIAKDFIVESIEIDDQYEEKENMHGRILVGSNYRKRKIVVPSYFKVKKLTDVARIRDLLYELVVDIEPVFIRELRKKQFSSYRFVQPTKEDHVRTNDDGTPINEDYDHNYNDFVNGKRYQVKFVGVIKPTQTGDIVNLDIEFETAELPFGESIGNSLDLEKNLTSSLWSTGMNIPFSQSAKRKYIFENVKSGSVYYYGNVKHDQFNMFSVVTIVIGESTKEFRWNLSGSELMTIEGIQLVPGDVIKYDGVQTFKNDNPINEYTSLARPVYQPGENKFTINQKVNSIKFNLKFYYK